jgi:hypothetical protein
VRLEDVRGMYVGDIALVLEPSSDPLAAAFHDHAQQAQWHTLNCLLRLGGVSIDGVANERIAVIEWWRTVESMIALVYHVACFESDHGLRQTQPRLRTSMRDGVLDRWSAIPRWFSGATESPPKPVTRRLAELRDFRNSFEHSSRQNTVDVKYSRLGAVPAYANLADAMEALAIAVEVASVLRNVLTGLDLMPQALVPSREHVFYVPLDRLASDLIFPQYSRVLGEQDLTSDVSLYPTPNPLSASSIIQPMMIIKAQPEAHDPQPSRPVGMWDAFEAFASSEPGRPGPEQFGIPRYQAARP